MKIRLLGLMSALSLVAACGGAGGGSISSLSQLPDASSMVATSTSSTALSLASVSGTAPLITDLKSSADQYFWNGLVATINGYSSYQDLTYSVANQFWGGVAGGPSGQGGCFMAQNTAQVFGRLMDSASSACYMKGMPKAESGVTITPEPSGGNENLFAQEAADKIVRVDISGAEHDSGGGGGGGDDQPERVLIKVYGSDSVGADVYKVQLMMCKSGSPKGYETFEVNKSTLAYSAASVHKDSDSAKFSSSMTATLKEGSGDTLEFDTSKDRTVLMKGSFSSDKFGAKVLITGENLIYNLMNHENGSNKDKIVSVSQFSGSSINDVRFLAAGFKGYNEGSSGNHTWEGALEWHDTYYAAISSSSSDLYTKANDIGLSDSFFSEDKNPTTDFTGVDCGASADYVVTMDFTDDAVKAIAEKCEANNKVKGSDNNYCWNSNVQTAQQRIFQYYSACNVGSPPGYCH